MRQRSFVTWTLGILACVSSLLPYFLPRYLLGWRIEITALIASGVWLVLVLATQISGGWTRRLWFLWLLFPVAFGPLLIGLYMFILGLLGVPFGP